jgi:hypothetical protein
VLCRSGKLSAHGRTLSAIIIGLGDEGDDQSPLLVYGQKQVEDDESTPGLVKTTLKLCVARRKLPPPPPSIKKVRPGDPLPRGKSLISTRRSPIARSSVRHLQHRYTPHPSFNIRYQRPCHLSAIIQTAPNPETTNHILLRYQVEHLVEGARKGRDHKQRRMRRNGKAAKSSLTRIHLGNQRKTKETGTRIYLGNDLL